jgi:hypothetical protein
VWDPSFFNMYVNIKKGDMREEDGPDKSDSVATVEVLKEKKGIIA